MACLKSLSTSGAPWSGGSRCSRQVRLSLRIASTKNSPVLQTAGLRLTLRLLQQDGKPHRMMGPSSKRHGLNKCKGREGIVNGVRLQLCSAGTAKVAPPEPQEAGGRLWLAKCPVLCLAKGSPAAAAAVTSQYCRLHNTLQNGLAMWQITLPMGKDGVHAADLHVCKPCEGVVLRCVQHA